MKIGRFKVDLDRNGRWIQFGIAYHPKGKLFQVHIGNRVLTIWKKYEK